MTENKKMLPDDERRAGQALERARQVLRRTIGTEPRGADIVFETIEVMVDVHTRERQRVSGAPSNKSSWWPDYLHTLDEHQEIYKQRMIDVAKGDQIERVFGLNMQPSPQDIETADAVHRIFRHYLVGKNRDRDWRILTLLAAGKPYRQVAKKVGIAHSRVADRKPRHFSI